MAKVAGYIRVSDQKLKTDGERRQDVNRQREKIEQFSLSMGWGTPEFYCDDGISAYKDDYNSRPDFVRMLHEIRARRIQRVIVEDLTRWSRRIEDGLRTVREATEAGCTITSMAEGEVQITIPDQWFKTAVAFLLAEWSSKSQSYKVSGGMQRRLENPKAVCEYCKEVHLGRHPERCMCKACLKRKGLPRLHEEQGGGKVKSYIKMRFPCGFEYELSIESWFSWIEVNEITSHGCPIHGKKCRAVKQ